MSVHQRLRARQPRLLDIPDPYGGGGVLYLDESNGRWIVSDGGNRILWVCPKCKGPQWVSLEVEFHAVDWFGGRECCHAALVASKARMGVLGLHRVGRHEASRVGICQGMQSPGVPG